MSVNSRVHKSPKMWIYDLGMQFTRTVFFNLIRMMDFDRTDFAILLATVPKMEALKLIICWCIKHQFHVFPIQANCFFNP